MKERIEKIQEAARIVDAAKHLRTAKFSTNHHLPSRTIFEATVNMPAEDAKAAHDLMGRLNEKLRDAMEELAGELEQEAILLTIPNSLIGFGDRSTSEETHFLTGMSEARMDDLAEKIRRS